MSELEHEVFPIEGEAVPLFPLPNLFLIPGALLPLHIFEERYRTMARDLLDSAGRLVLGTVLKEEGAAMGSNPTIEPLAGLGYLENYQILPDGRFLILVRGLDQSAAFLDVSGKNTRSDRYVVPVQLYTARLCLATMFCVAHGQLEV